jgi:hypothetical protein
MLPELSVSSSRFSFSNTNYNYDNTNTNVSSHLCNKCSVNLALLDSYREAKNNNELKSAGISGERDLLKAKA